MLIPIFYSVLFVLSVYIWKFVKRTMKWKKNDKNKTLVVSLAVFIMLITQMITSEKNLSLIEYLNLNISFNTFIIPIVCNSLLFLGPLYQLFQDDELLFKLKSNKLITYSNWKKLIIAPFLEEFVFRVLFYDHFENDYDYKLFSTIFFSLAHAHQFYRIWRKGQNVKRALVQTCFILMYTLIFGLYSSTLYVKTKSLISVMILHSYCNFMGFPQINTIMRRSKQEQIQLIVAYSLGILFFWIYI